MIVDVDRALMAMLRREVLGNAPVEVVIEVPNRPWTQGVKKPTVDLFLYDVRENVQLREVMHEAIRDDKGFVVGHRPPARRFDLFYVVSVWGCPIAAEHQLMSAIVGGLSEHAVVPPDYLSDGLKETGHEIFLNVADGMRRGMLPSFAGEMKLQLELSVTACMPAKSVSAVGVPVRKGVELRTRAPGLDETVTPATERKGLVLVDTSMPKAEPAATPPAQSQSQAAQPPTQPPAQPSGQPQAAATTQAQAQAMTDAAKAKDQAQVQQAVSAPPPAAKPPPGAAPNGDPVAKLAAALTQAAQVQAALAQTMAQCVAALGGAAAGPAAAGAASAGSAGGDQPAKKAAAPKQPPKQAPPAPA